MTNANPANSDDGETPAIIQSEAREMRSKQDRKLENLLRFATGALLVYLSIGTIAVAASDTHAPATAGVVFSFAGILALGLVIIGAIVSDRWKEGPDIKQLLSVYRTRQPTAAQLHIALTIALDDDYDNNHKTLRYVRAVVAVLAATAFFGLLILLAGLNELT